MTANQNNDESNQNGAEPDPDPEPDPEPVEIGGVEIVPDVLDLGVGESQTLTVTVTDETGDTIDDGDYVVDWQSNNETVATVDDSGEVTGVAEGEATVTATVEGEAAQAQVTVTEKYWRDVVAGSDVTCGVSMEGQLYCWGSDFHGSSGQQGQAAPLNSEPLGVPLGAEIVGVTAGYLHYCAWDSGGQTYCWGFNQFGQVGAPASESIVVPTLIGGHSFSKVEASGQYTCGLSDDGEIYCWGLNYGGELGRPGEPNTHTPTPVPIDAEMVDVSAGPAHACGIDEDGEVYCWGRNFVGAVDPGIISDQVLAPTQVNLDVAAVQVVTGATSTCVLSEDEEIWCWGYNAYGEMGREGTLEAIAGPGAVESDEAFAEVSIFGHSICGVTTNQKMMCWGENRFGAVGDGSLADQHTPTEIGDEQSWANVSAGNGHACGIDAAGDLWCWGSNSLGQVGDGRLMFRINAEPVSSGDVEFSSLLTGNYNLCGVSDDETYCWGRNENYQHQTDRPGHSSEPVPLEHWSPDQLALGDAFKCGIDLDGQSAGPVKCWGSNAHQRLGIDEPDQAVMEPTQIDSDRDFLMVGAGTTHACAVSDEHEIYCWGGNEFGQVSHQFIEEVPSPRRVESEMDFETVVMGFDHSCGLSDEGQVQCWGANEFGQLGADPQSTTEGATDLDFDHSFVDIGAGNFYSCGLSDDDDIVCWGNAMYFTGVPGESLGDEPIVFEGDYESLHVGDGIVCGLDDGEIHCAGWDQDGWIAGLPLSPVQEMTSIDVSFDVEDVAVGPAYVCMLDTEGFTNCLGHDAWGVLGAGATVIHSMPNRVLNP